MPFKTNTICDRTKINNQVDGVCTCTVIGIESYTVVGAIYLYETEVDLIGTSIACDTHMFSSAFNLKNSFFYKKITKTFWRRRN